MYPDLRSHNKKLLTKSGIELGTHFDMGVYHRLLVETIIALKVGSSFKLVLGQLVLHK